MSKVLLLIIMFLFSFSIINAQSNFNYGIKLGISNSDFNQNYEATSPIPGLRPAQDLRKYYDGNSINPTIGVFLNYQPLENLVLESEVSYIIKGSRKTHEITVTTLQNPDGRNKEKLTGEYSSHYLELGINLKPTLKIWELPFYLIVGASINYDIQTINRIHSEIEDLHFSYKFGTGVDVSQFINMPIFFEFKYSKDFSDYYSNSFMKLKNRVFSLTMGIYL